MTERHLALVRQAVEAWNANDWDTIRELNHPDVEILAPPGWPEAGTFKGWDAVHEQFERLKDPWSEEQVTILGLEEVSDGVVLCNARWIGEGQTSGIEMDLEMWVIYAYEDDKIVLTGFNFDREAALRMAEEL
jgi:hypothetical protein